MTNPWTSKNDARDLLRVIGMTKRKRRRGTFIGNRQTVRAIEVFDDDPDWDNLDELIAAAREVSHAWHFEDNESLSFDAKMIRLRKALSEGSDE